MPERLARMSARWTRAAKASALDGLRTFGRRIAGSRRTTMGRAGPLTMNLRPEHERPLSCP